MIVKLLRRTTYGVTPADVEYAASAGFDGYLSEQLHPGSISDPEFENQFARLIPTPEIQNFSFAQLYQRYREYPVRLELVDTAFLRAIYSRKQLFERMVEFWTDHFNMDSLISFGGFFQAVRDRDVTRQFGLEHFHELLLASCTNAGMLTFLTNVTNIAGHPNENFARELLELHTLGVSSGYTQNDVNEVARCFTGWTCTTTNEPTSGGLFQFNPNFHDSGEKTVLGNTIPAGLGIQDGLIVIRMLADHPATSTFIARKLCRWFLEETPRESVVQAAALRFRQTQGDIREVLKAIITPNNLFAAGPKYKRPFHLIASGMRAIQPVMSQMWPLRTALRECGHPLFEWGPPDGFPDTMQYWGGGQMARWNFCSSLGENRLLDMQSDASTFYQGMTMPQQVLDEMNRRFLQGEMSGTDRQILLDFLAFDPNSPRQRRAVTGLLLAIHGFQWY